MALNDIGRKILYFFTINVAAWGFTIEAREYLLKHIPDSLLIRLGVYTILLWVGLTYINKK